MPCYSPLYGRLHVTPNGVKGRPQFLKEDNDMFYFKGKFPQDQLVYHPVKGKTGAEVLKSCAFPCRKCFGCKKERARQWSIRCVHEASLHEKSSFVTLTFNDAALKARGHKSVSRRDVQLFIKRLRKFYSDVKIRVYYASEYGKKHFRPHYHILLFGVDFEDKKLLKSTAAGSKLYTSAILEKLWPFGYSSVGAVTQQSAAYVAQYTLGKVSTSTLDALGLTPEFQGFSNRPRHWSWMDRQVLEGCLSFRFLCCGWSQTEIPRVLRSNHESNFFAYF